MPTTDEEAARIVKICERHGVSGKQLFEVILDMRNEVGLYSENWSVRDTFEMLLEVAKDAAMQFRPAIMTEAGFRAYLEEKCRPPEADPCSISGEREQIREMGRKIDYVLWWCWFVVWLTLIGLHHFMVLGNVASFFALPFLAPWYIAFPGCFAIIWVVCSPVDCAVTKWENIIRAQLGWPEIKGFIKHYYWRNGIKRLWNATPWLWDLIPARE